MTVGVSEAEGFWWWRCGRPWAWGGGCTPFYCAPSYSVGCNPCGTTQCGWYLGYRPGPIRRLLFGPYRWYYACTPTYYSTTACYAPTADVGYDAGGAAPTFERTPARAERPAEAPQQEPRAEEPEPEPPAGSQPEGPLPGGLREPEPAAPGTGGGLFGPERELPEPPVVEPSGGVDLSPLPETEPSGEDGGLLPPEGDTEPPAAVPGLEPSTPALPRRRSSDPLGPTSRTETRGDSGLLTIYVPRDAQVEVNGLLTRSKGSRREYVSYGLKRGYSYKYEIEAQVVRDGKLLRDARTVVLTAGDTQSVAFAFDRVPASNVASTW